MSEKRFTLDIWDRDLYISNVAIACVGLIFYNVSPRVNSLFLTLGAIIFLNFCLWLDCVGKGREG